MWPPEQALVDHKATFPTMLDSSSGEGSKGDFLGTSLPDSLSPDCFPRCRSRAWLKGLAAYQLRDHHLSHPQHAVPKKINEIRESLNMFGKLNENVINIEYFSLLILIENLVLPAAFCSMSWFKDMRHRQSTPSEYLFLRIIFSFRLFLEQHMQLYRRKTRKLSLGILVKKGNYEITLFLPQE